MFTHVMVGSKDPERSRSFYDKVLGALGYEASNQPAGADRHFYGSFGTGAFAVGKPREGEAVASNGGMISFGAPSRDAVNSFHREALANGGTCEGPPGPRQGPVGEVYGAYVRDPDGNKLASFSTAV